VGCARLPDRRARLLDAARVRGGLPPRDRHPREPPRGASVACLTRGGTRGTRGKAKAAAPYADRQAPPGADRASGCRHGRRNGHEDGVRRRPAGAAPRVLPASRRAERRAPFAPPEPR